MKKKTAFFYDLVLSYETKNRFERIIFYIALVAFLTHLALIGLMNMGIFDIPSESAHIISPISAIYTPFSIILFYEIYCLIYFLPKSMSIYIGKQYEIITLIVIRGMFNEVANLNNKLDIYGIFQHTQLIYTMLTVIILFVLIFLYYKLDQSAVLRVNNKEKENVTGKNLKYFKAKKILAIILGMIFFLMLIYSLIRWFTGNYASFFEFLDYTKYNSKLFFNHFFVILILADVLILLLSFRVMDDFHKVVRNSGFVISTIILMVSFSYSELTNHILIILGVLFGTAMLGIFNWYEKIELPKEIKEKTL